MFSICKELHPPTGVEEVTYCYFFDRREKNLVVAGANSIRVFRFIPDIYDECPGLIIDRTHSFHTPTEVF